VYEREYRQPLVAAGDDPPRAMPVVTLTWGQGMDDLEVGDRVTVRWENAGQWEITPPTFLTISAKLPDGRFAVDHSHPDPRFHHPLGRDVLTKGWIA
jgi:hypothetical protein